MDRHPGEIELARRLVRAHSPSGSESPAAQVLLEAMRELDYDRAYLDDAGNAIGVFERGVGPVVMFNGHIDTVPAGDLAAWPHPPYEGEIAADSLWGRGSVDMKGAVACMALAGRDAVDRGFAGTLVMTGVVQEEVGGLGARHLARCIEPDVVILGEPSNLHLMLGHRGRIEVEVALPGRIAHAAKASLGENALYRAARFLARLEQLALPQGGVLGGSTVTPTHLRSYPGGANVVPGRVEITLDYRNIPEDGPEAALERIAALDPEAQLRIPPEKARSESGKVSLEFPRINPAYLAPNGAPAVETARRVLREMLSGQGRSFEEGAWWFATDAPYLASRGAPVIGFGPGDPELAHTSNEHIPLEHLALAREAYAMLALSYGGKG